jgi:hypothetical protein
MHALAATGRSGLDSMCRCDVTVFRPSSPALSFPVSEMSSDEEERSFSFKPLSGSLALKAKVEASKAAAESEARSPRFSTASQIADKYRPKPATPVAAAMETTPDVPPPSTAPKLPFQRPSGASPTATPRRQKQQQEDSLNDSVNPGQQHTPLPSAASVANSSQKQPGASSSPANETRYSYPDHHGGNKLQKRVTTESSPSSDEESMFTKTVKPLIGSSLWKRSIEQESKRAPVASPVREEEKYDLRGSPPDRPNASSTAGSPGPPASASFHGQHDLSQEFQALQKAWVQQEEENQQLKANLRQQEQKSNRTLQPSEAQRQPPSPVPSHQQLQLHRHPTVSSPTFTSDIDALSALQLAHESDRAANEAATRAFLTNDSYYPQSIELHEVLADHKRLRQRLRAAQHAIEALAANTESGAIDGAASLAAQVGRGGSASSRLAAPGRRGYMPAMQAPPSALSMSQYAHLPPARAVLKLLNRLEKEEESYMADRAAWKAEKSAIGRQMSALTADLRHLTSLAQQSQLNEEFFRRREAEHEDTLARLKKEREAERERWAEIEKEMRGTALRERVQFNSDIAQLEKDSGHFHQKYQAVLAILRRYEHERSVPQTVSGAEIVQNQKKMFAVIEKEADAERAALAEQLARQEKRFVDLSNAQSLADRNRDAELKELRDQMARETRRRLEAEQQVLKTQQSVTRSLDEKLQSLQGIPLGASGSEAPAGAAAPPSSYRPPAESARDRRSAEAAGEEIARAYALQRPKAASRSRERLEREYVEHTRGRSRHPPARPSYDSASSGRSLSPPVPREARSSSRGRREKYRPHKVSTVRELLARLPDDAEVNGDIEFVLPEDGRSAPYYRERERSERSRQSRSPRYTRPTYSSDHAAAIALREYGVPSRSHSPAPGPDSSRRHPPLRSRSRPPPPPSNAGDEHYSDASVARRARSHSRAAAHRDRVVGGTAYGHVKRSSSTSRSARSSYPPAPSQRPSSREADEYDRYGRVSRQRTGERGPKR